jgi:hypothetical protein
MGEGEGERECAHFIFFLNIFFKEKKWVGRFKWLAWGYVCVSWVGQQSIASREPISRLPTRPVYVVVCPYDNNNRNRNSKEAMNE